MKNKNGKIKMKIINIECKTRFFALLVQIRSIDCIVHMVMNLKKIAKNKRAVSRVID